MNNEEKILTILTTLASDMYIVKAGQANLEASIEELKVGQAKLEAGQTKLEARQAMLETKVDNVEAIAQATHNNLVRLEGDYNSVRGALFDKIDDLENKVSAVRSEIVDIKERLDTDELYIRVVDNKLRLGLNPTTN